jgi:hypothetical protein
MQSAVKTAPGALANCVENVKCICGRECIPLDNDIVNDWPKAFMEIVGAQVGQIKGEVPTVDVMDAHNMFENPDAIHPVVFERAKLAGNKLSVILPAKSVVVLKLG